MFFARPGQVGPVVALQQARRQVHEGNRETIVRALAERVKHHIRLDEDTDWKSVQAALADVIAASNAAEARAVALAVLERVKAPLADPGPYVERPELAGIQVRFRALSAARHAELLAAAGAAQGLTEVHVAMGAYVREACAAVLGLRVQEDDGKETFVGFSADAGEPVSDEVIGLLVDSGVVVDVYTCARTFQVLGPFARTHYGLSPPSPTSATSTATDAGTTSSAGATVEQPSRSSTTTPVDAVTPAPGGSSSTTDGSARSGERPAPSVRAAAA